MGYLNTQKAKCHSLRIHRLFNMTSAAQNFSHFWVTHVTQASWHHNLHKYFTMLK